MKPDFCSIGIFLANIQSAIAVITLYEKMLRLQIPYSRVLLNPRDFDPSDFDSLLKHFIEVSRNHPLVMEIFNNHIQYLLFVRDGQPYWASVSTGDAFTGLSLKEFFSKIRRAQFPQIVVYFTTLTLYHSLIVYLQKKPDLKVSSSLVDLDDLLDKTESENKSALITAYQPGNLLMLRFQDGKEMACYHERAEGRPDEANIREDFLVKVYTLTTHRPFEINLFTDLAVTHSEDSRPLPENFQGSVLSFYLSQAPKIVVKLKNRPLKTYPFNGKEMSIGRLPKNDIVIDNLSVSRRHAVIQRTKKGYKVNDNGSKNGTFLNGKQIEESLLKDGDVITIGKYQIVFQAPTCEESSMDSLDQTVIIPNFHKDGAPGSNHAHLNVSPDTPPKLFRRSNNENYPLEKETTLIGKEKDADIRIAGLFSPRVSLKITRRGNDYIAQKFKGRKSPVINGVEMEEKILDEEDLIAIGPEEFVFKR
jgi:pSer/pThr/pTyr-binding forkhead associated (FHA) protein